MFILETEQSVARLTLSRPPVNAINNEWISRFHAALDEFQSRDDWSVLLIRSDQKVFCAGADLAQVRTRFGVEDGADLMVEDVAGFHRLFDRIEALPQVTLTEIGGPAMGGGLELALACDLRIAALEARMGLPEARLGLIPGAGGTQRLTWLCGRGAANRIILAGDLLDGAAAERLGLVQWAVPANELASRALAIASHIASLPRAAIYAAKKCIGAAGDPLRDGFREELEATRQMMGNAETRERVGRFLAGRLR